MSQQQVLLGVLAIVAGAAISIVAFVPFVAISYRRLGSFSWRRGLTWAAALVYAWAIWTYTLLPLPDPAQIECVVPNTDWFGFIGDLRALRAETSGLRAFLTDFTFLQLAFNVLLFIPLGFFLRLLGGRGVIVATLVGFGTSMLVELTQYTGVWGIYSCAYRFFDVDDLVTNTSGALLGSVLCLFVPRELRTRQAGPEAHLPRPVTRGRRLTGALCDWLALSLLQAAVTVGTRVVLALLEARTMATDMFAGFLGSGVALATWTVVTLATGRTVGDLAVQLSYRGGRLPTALARLLRLVFGIGGYAALGLLLGQQSGWTGLFVLVSLVALLCTRAGRGLPGLLSGQQVFDARAPISGARPRPRLPED